MQYGKLIEPFREYMGEAGTGPVDEIARAALQRWMLLTHLPIANSDSPGPGAGSSGPMDRPRLAACARAACCDCCRADCAKCTACCRRCDATTARCRKCLPAEGPRRARVALFLGCVADAIYPETQIATARVLQKNGCEVWIPRSQQCCGALHYHSAMEEPARELAAKNLRRLRIHRTEA